MSVPPLVLDVSGVAVFATPVYLEWIAGTADYLTSRDFWVRRGVSPDDARQIATNFDNLIADIVLRKEAMATQPISTIISAISIDDPAWILCDGRIIQEADYPELYAILLPHAINGLVKVPNMQGRAIIGAGSMMSNGFPYNYDLFDDGGEVLHTLLVGEMPSHNHHTTVNSPAMSANQIVATGGAQTGSGFGVLTATTGTRWQVGLMPNAGSGNPHNNMQPYFVARYYIKAL